MAVKSKQKYRLASGEVVPGVTTIIGDLGWSKRVLINWANKLGLNGIDANRYVDDKASIGTLAHTYILSSLKGIEPDTSDYTANQIAQAKNCIRSYDSWKNGKTIEPLIVEEMMVSEALRVGGTPDFYGKVDGVCTLIDYKSGKGIFPEHIIQTATYAHLITEKGHTVDEVRILNIPRSDDESFAEKVVTGPELKAGFEVFKHLLAIWNLKGAVKKGY